MTVPYDKYYETENLFGEPYAELMAFFNSFPLKGSVLDLGCGQGRDAIPLARIGFTVTGVDSSLVGIDQMNQLAQAEKLPLKGLVSNIFEFNEFHKFDFILLDSMFHFTKRDRVKESDYIARIFTQIKKGGLVIFCIQDTGQKVEILQQIIRGNLSVTIVENQKFKYVFEDNDHQSESDYRMIVIKK